MLKKGRYGPYVTDGSINASLPKAVEVDDLTLEQAIEMLAKKAANPRTKRRRRKPRK